MAAEKEQVYATVCVSPNLSVFCYDDANCCVVPLPSFFIVCISGV